MREKYESLALVQLKELAKVRGLKGTSTMKKAEIVEAMLAEDERLKKEEEKLTKELARVNGMLSNERFISKAPQAKIDEEKAKLEKYTQMMDQVKERLAQLTK